MAPSGCQGPNPPLCRVASRPPRHRALCGLRLGDNLMLSGEFLVEDMDENELALQAARR
jgi:hypothetical protein